MKVFQRSSPTIFFARSDADFGIVAAMVATQEIKTGETSRTEAESDT